MAGEQRAEDEPRLHLGKALTAGLIGGLVGAWVMNQVQGWLERLELGNPGGQPAAGAGSSATDPEAAMVVTAVSRQVLHRPLAGHQAAMAAIAVHYAFGAAAGGLYSVLAEAAPAAGAGLGVPFGALLWAGAEAAAASMRGLADVAAARSPGSHARDLLTHCVFGLTTDVVRRLV